MIVYGKKIGALRDNPLAMTQAELAKAIGISTTRLSKIENAPRAGMRPGNFRKLADLLKLSPADLFAQIGVEGTEGVEEPDEPEEPPAPDDIDLTPLSAEELAGLKSRIRDEEARRRKHGPPVIRDPVGPGPGRRKG